VVQTEVVAAIVIIVVRVITILALFYNPITATCSERCVGAPKPWFTEIIGAFVGIITIKVPCARAAPIDAAVTDGANLPIIAGSVNRCVGTPSIGVTTIIGAELVVIAIQIPRGNTSSCHAAVARGAPVPIIAVSHRWIV
tara:strand:+ start:71 stop:490 length:420 start_codon:yes stop_codon:yes gene_type:complete